MKQPLPGPGSTYRNRAVILVMNIVLALAAVAAVAALVLEYGFRTLPVPRAILHVAETVIVAIFVLDRVLRMLLARRRWRYFRENWIDFALIVVAGAVLIISYQFHWQVVSAGALYVVITQAYILIHLVLRGVSVNLRFAGSGIHPSWLLIGSFAFLILTGTGLLLLEKATPVDRTPLSFVDAVFTATSATCVTGLVVRETGGDFTRLGQGVIFCLIQSGGLGIMLFGTVFALLVGKELSVRQSSALGHMLATDRAGGLKRTVLFVVAITLAIEAVGALLFYPMFSAAGGAGGGPPATPKAVWQSVFHGVSSFCNAGFSLFSRNMMQGVRSGWPKPLRDHWQIVGVMAPLIVLGGLGFPVLRDCARYACGGAARLIRRLFRARARPAAPARLSLHAKVVLAASACLVILGALVLLAVEPPRTAPAAGVIGAHPLDTPDREDRDWPHVGRLRRTREAVFQSITARTAGFNTIDVAELSDAGKLSLCWLMMVGGSPASTAGGMKTVTFALLLVSAYCAIRRRNELEVFKRSIPLEIFRKAVTLAVLYLGLISAVTILLCVAMRQDHRFTFIDLFFESCSACGTVGLSTGVTANLNVFGKYVIVAGMFIGRLGPLTLLLALTSSLRHVKYSYPSENVVIG